MSSLPEVIFSVNVSGEASQVHASAEIVRSSRTTRTSRPAIGLGTVGVTAMSSSAQGPVGATRTGSRRFFFLPSARCGSIGVALGVTVTVEVGTAATGVAASGPEVASLPAPSPRASAKTSSTAATTSNTRRRQYTRGGRGPRVRDVMAQR